MKHLPRSQEALVEAAYHVIFGPWANLKGRQQLHGKYEWNKKKVTLSLSFWFIPVFGYFSSQLLLWLGSSCRWGWMKNKFPGLKRNFSVLQGFCPQKPGMCTNLSETAAAAGLCISWDFPLLVLGIPRVLLHPRTGLGRQGISDIFQMPEPSSEFSVHMRIVWLLMKIPKQPFGNQMTHGYSYWRISKCLIQCLTCIPFLNPNRRTHRWRRTSEMGAVLRNPGCRIALIKMTLNSLPVRYTNMKDDIARGPHHFQSQRATHFNVRPMATD